MKRLKIIANSWWFRWVLLGVVIRVLLSMFTQHPDIWGISLTPSFFAYHGVWNIYDDLGNLDINTSDYARNLGNTFNTADIFIYPPLSYFTLGSLMFLLRPFYDGSYFAVVAANLEKTLGDPALFRYLLLAKLPYFLFDFASLYFIVQFFKQQNVGPKLQRLAFFLWLFNPVTIYATYMVGNFDIVPVFFTIAGTYFLATKRYGWGFLLFGLGAAYKTYPILIAIPLIFLFGNKLIEKIRYGFYLLAPLVLTSLPYLTTPEYRRDVLFNPKNTKFLFMGLPVSGAEVLYVFIVGVTLVCLAAAYIKKKDIFWAYPLAILALLYSVTHYHPQWMVWIVPFMVILFVKEQWARWPIAILFASFVGIVFFFEPSLNVSLFGPLFPNSHDFKGLTALLTGHTDVFQLKSLLRSVFAGVSIFIIGKLLFTKQTTHTAKDEVV